jgi:hypothetical protein
MAEYLTAPSVGEMLNAPAVPARRVPERDLLDYYLGPTGVVERAAAANEVLNPIVALSDAGQDLRRGDYLGALTNTAAAAVPIAGGRMAIKAARGVPSLAPRTYDDVTSAVTETLTGVSAPKPSDVTDMTRRQFMTGVAAAGGTAAMGPDLSGLAKKAAPDVVNRTVFDGLLAKRAKKLAEEKALEEPLGLLRQTIRAAGRFEDAPPILMTEERALQIDEARKAIAEERKIRGELQDVGYELNSIDQEFLEALLNTDGADEILDSLDSKDAADISRVAFDALARKVSELDGGFGDFDSFDDVLDLASASNVDELMERGLTKKEAELAIKTLPRSGYRY